MEALRTPASKAEVVRMLDVQRPELLEVLLELGVSLGELSSENDLYGVRGRRSQALAAADGDALGAVIQEFVTYHGSVYRHLAERLKGASLGSYLEGTDTLIARSSRILEPFLRDFVRDVVNTDEPMRILEVGCGSGIYLRPSTSIWR